MRRGVLKNLDDGFLALAYKFPHISSFRFLKLIKNALIQAGVNVKKIGFSGTLDPFARGQLILATNGCTRLFPHIDKAYKTYRATMFLGCKSLSLDIENLISIREVERLDLGLIKAAVEGMRGKISYTPPSFSAKHVGGTRAYKLAREGKEFSLEKCEMEVRLCRLMAYNHPFISFEVELSEGGFVRSICELIATRLGVAASLCYLERLGEGRLYYKKRLDSSRCLGLECGFNGVKHGLRLVLIDPSESLKYDRIDLSSYAKQAGWGQRFRLNKASWATGARARIYLADFGSHYGIVDIAKDGEVKYIVNRINKC